jgi:hypothetical protein
MPSPGDIFASAFSDNASFQPSLLVQEGKNRKKGQLQVIMSAKIPSKDC